MIPSPRISDRVPFGTGKAVGDWVNSSLENYMTYNFSSFELLKDFVELIPELYSDSFDSFKNKNNHAKKFDAFFQYLDAEKFDQILEEIKSNSTNLNSFISRFYRWFDAFKVLKLIHYLRDNQFPNSNIQTESFLLLNKIIKVNTKLSVVELLEHYRGLDKK